MKKKHTSDKLKNWFNSLPEIETIKTKVFGYESKYYLRMSNPAHFRVSEINQIAEILKMPAEKLFFEINKRL